MDASEQYIKMCGCVEIQGTHQFVTGDCYTLDRDWFCSFTKWVEKRGKIYTVDSIAESNPNPTNVKMTWLPRQDQLQELCEKPYLSIADSLRYLFNFIMENIETYKTFEQIWLAYYMKEKHNKVWDGESWAIK